MQNFINNRIHRIYGEFQQEVRRVGRLCACKDLTYVAGNSPDYNNSLIQQYYMLRYFPAYLVEYYDMYKRLIEQNFLEGRLKVISIGCGCGIDLWGLNFAIQDTNNRLDMIDRYTGIDITDWLYRDDLNIQNASLIIQDISTWHQMDENDYNVFIFPKCIGEFTDEVFESVCRLFENTVFTENQLFGLCSLKTIGTNSDIDRFNQITRILENTHGYRSLDPLNEYMTCNPSPGLRRIFPQFVYPNNVLNNLNVLLTGCPTFSAANSACDHDCNDLNRSPILTAAYINYKLMRFEREY